MDTTKYSSNFIYKIQNKGLKWPFRWCEMCSPKLKSAFALRVFEKQVPWKIFRPNTEVVRLDQRKLHNKKLHNLYFSRNNVANHTDRLVMSIINSRNVIIHLKIFYIYLRYINSYRLNYWNIKLLFCLMDYTVKPDLSI